MNPGRLRHRIDVYGKIEIENELEEVDYIDSKIKTIWAAIIPQTASLQRGQVETILSNTTHKIIVRYSAGKDITQDMYIMFRGKRFDIKYILNPYFKNEFLEIFCEEVIE
ncbi:head-tail adaptor protein (plasmid) [Crassaminicella thermophila]|uniref:Head-tail adaptor protein n=1 Tax=Crassaminicella thermophila TaxID=2599308 RepID=A0A5C0SGV5_CRATE|nr:phage head closure protein [Crassaminicella thermophila]QEK13723.1 head-tail adaptor protein [Crassaminicella thermophila]